LDIVIDKLHFAPARDTRFEFLVVHGRIAVLLISFRPAWFLSLFVMCDVVIFEQIKMNERMNYLRKQLPPPNRLHSRRAILLR